MTEIVDERQRLVLTEKEQNVVDALLTCRTFDYPEVMQKVHAIIMRLLASPSEGNKKGDGHTVTDTGGGFCRVLDPQGDAVGTFISREHANEYAQRCTARLASRPQEQPRKATGEMVEAASRAVVAEWRVMLQEVRGAMSAAEIAQGFVSPGNFRLIRAALEAALAVSAAQGWQMIETAPKDGRRILGYRPAENAPPIYGRIEVLSFVEEDQEWWDDSDNSVSPPTHWMPLPAAPPSPQEQEKGEQT